MPMLSALFLDLMTIEWRDSWPVDQLVGRLKHFYFFILLYFFVCYHRNRSIEIRDRATVRFGSKPMNINSHNDYDDDDDDSLDLLHTNIIAPRHLHSLLTKRANSLLVKVLMALWS